MTSLQSAPREHASTPDAKPAHRRPRRHDDDPFLTLTADHARPEELARPEEAKDTLAVRLLLAPLLALSFVLSLAITDRRARAATSRSNSSSSVDRLAPAGSATEAAAWTVRVRRWWRPAAAGGGGPAGGEAWVIRERHRATISTEMREAWDRRAGVLAGLLVAAGAFLALVLVACAWAWARWWA